MDPKQLDLTQHWAGYLSLSIMVLAYAAAMLEEVTALRKSTPMLLAAGLIWTIIVLVYQQHGDAHLAADMFDRNLLTYAELLFFIMVSMTYLNRMDDMQVFDALRVKLLSKGMSYRQLFWVTGVLVFFMSLFLNGLTAGLLMGSIVIAVGKKNAHFVSLACINIVVATNAGGSVSPLGGISTLFVWQHGMLQFTDFFKLLLPCLVNFLVPALFMQFAISKDYPAIEVENIIMQRGAKFVVCLFGITILLTVWVDMFLAMPPAFGMMAGLSLLNLFNYYLQKSPDTSYRSSKQLFKNLVNANMSTGIAKYQHLNITDEVSSLYWDTLLFFYGAMMGIGGLGYIGYLDAVSHILYGLLSPTTANILIGLSSAFIDNGTLMFAVLTMHPDIPPGQWLLLTLTLGVGGSLLAIGSAPGIGLLGLAKGQYTFSEHLKWFPVILLGYFASIGVHFLVNARYF
ncbi:MAG: sodium:proton antiporter NhaD [Methylococcaceae bacterium]|nr:sodium:proton antiporter NhaD [Methylococcaceae bacterium]